MVRALRLCALVSAFALVGCGDDAPSGNPGTGGSGGSAGSVGTGGMTGSGGATGVGGDAGIGGTGGMGGSPITVEPCTDDGLCSVEDDCVCPECDDDLFCGDAANCGNDGSCNEFTEGCVCEDCANLPVCAR